MRTDYDLLSTTPPEENESDFGSREDGKRYIELLRRTLGPEPGDSFFKMMSHPHDLGSYVTVVYFFDDEDPEQVRYMQRIEDEGPLNWDDKEA